MFPRRLAWARSRFPRALRGVTRAACVLAASLTVLALGAGAAEASASVTWPSGVFAGYGPAGDASFGAFRGLPVTVATDYLGSDNWSQIEDPAWDISAWQQAPSIQPDLSVAVWPATGGSLEAAARGDYNTHFATLAQNLVAGGLGSTGIRLGWEFNATWYRWSVGTPAAAAQFAAAWRQIVTAMRSVPGANFSFDWAPNLQATGVDPALAYPGDAYVSEIGMDVYDWNESGANETPSQRWSDIVNKGYGLAWQAMFAAAHRKPIAFPEWGLVGNAASPASAGGDDPAFVQNMFNWFQTHNVAFENYFDSDATALGLYDGITTGNQLFPAAAAMYQKLYSGQAVSSGQTVSSVGTAVSVTLPRNSAPVHSVKPQRRLRHAADHRRGRVKHRRERVRRRRPSRVWAVT